MPLVLTRKPGQSVRIGDDIVVRLTEIGQGQVKLEFTAPKEVSVHREEVWMRIRERDNDQP